MDHKNGKKDVSDFFPLRTIGDVLKLFECQLEQTNGEETNGKEPNLALLSIVAGAIENSMTQCKPLLREDTYEDLQKNSNIKCDNELGGKDDDLTNINLAIEPVLHWDLVSALYQKFESIIKGFCDVNILQSVRCLSSTSESDRSQRSKNVRVLVKHVADIVWNTLSKSQYKDRAHLQSIYSYLTGNKLDCFGVAFAVVAACQLLEVNDVHLALSEDHAWVVFGKDGEETAEVTWHGKGNEDKRGRPVEIAKAKTSWLYVAGQPVVCDRYMELTALVNSINPAINATTDSLEVGELQKELLWLLYDQGHLKSYPMAIDNLGDLEEISPSLGRPHCTKLYEEAIEFNKSFFDNHHVYPYTYQGGYFYRAKNFKGALEAWSKAADVIKLYKYSKDDEEIYKEFMEIANELIPHVMKAEAASNKSPDENVLNDPICFGHLIRFYDGICCWEEGSPTPVLHIGWAKPMVASFSKFDACVRTQLKISTLSESEADDMNQEDLDEGNSYSSSSSFCNLSSHENISVDTDDNNSLQNESFQSTSTEDGSCLLISPTNENKDDKLDCLSVGTVNVPDSIQTKSNNKFDDENGEIAINNNYYEKYPTTKSTSIPCDTTLSSTSSINSSFTSSCEIESVKIKSNTTVINNKVSKNGLPSVENYVCDNDDHVQSKTNSNQQKRKYFNNPTSSQEYCNKSEQNFMSASFPSDLNRCERNNCDIEFSMSKNYAKQKHEDSFNGVVSYNKYNHGEREEVVNMLSGVCGTKLLSVDYLLGQSSEPFVADNPNHESFSVSKLLLTRKHKRKTIKPKTPCFNVLISGDSTAKSSPGNLKKLELQSAKMMGLKELLCAEKINTSAIQLQLTAQSQTDSKKPNNVGNNFNSLSEESLYLLTSSSSGSRPKRSRRE